MSVCSCFEGVMVTRFLAYGAGDAHDELLLLQDQSTEEWAQKCVRTPQMGTSCEGCGAVLLPSRRGRRHCNAACRKAAERHRQIERLERLRPDDPGRPE